MKIKTTGEQEWFDHFFNKIGPLNIIDWNEVNRLYNLGYSVDKAIEIYLDDLRLK